MALKIVAGIGLALALLAVFIATRPSAFRVARSVTINARPDYAFSLVNDFREWSAWSPYEKLDPQMKRAYTGPRSGEGAVYSYSGNDKAGQGRITIEKSVPGSRVELKLEFLKPFTVTNQGSFMFEREGNATKVTWAMEGRNNFLFKAVGLVMNVDKLVGTEFEKGLAALKTQAENAQKHGSSVATAAN
jgi:hypothetical protein